jgi:2-keto-4-pentenoate hydratase/2-oxohepta-3-ene-1,7-dioic acid hydratase in catechol pathway
MKVAVFGPARRVGIVHEGFVVDASAAYDKYVAETTDPARPTMHTTDVPSELNAFIEQGAPAIDGAHAAVEHLFSHADGDLGAEGQQIRFPLDQVVLHPPVAGASRVFAALANFADHMEAAAANTGATDAQATLARLQSGGPKYFMKDPRCASTDGDEIRYPARTSHLDYEAEVAVVIGKRGRDLQPDEFRSYIWGYAVANDWSIRDNVSFGPDFQYSKNFDTATGIGPWIVVDEGIYPQDIAVETRVNGELRQSGNTKSMIHDFASLGAFLSRDMTLYPGDLILSGTPKGTAVDSSKRLDDGTFPDDSLFVGPGDIVEVSSRVLGALTNKIVKAS